MLAIPPPPPRSSPHFPCVPACLHWRRPPCSSSNHAALVLPTSRGNFRPSVPVHPHVLSALAACDACAVSAPDSIAPLTTSSAAGSAHSLPHDRRSPSARPLTSARTALLPPRNTSCPPTATLVPGISAASFGSTPSPRFRASALWRPLLDSVWPNAWSGDSSAPSSPRRFPVLVRRFSPAPIPQLVAIPCSSSLSFPIWPPVETSRLGDISIVVTSSKGDISNVAAWGHYQSRATRPAQVWHGLSMFVNHRWAGFAGGFRRPSGTPLGRAVPSV